MFVDPFDTGGLGVDPADIPYRPRPYRDGQPVDEYPVAPDSTFPDPPQAIPDGAGADPSQPYPRVVTGEPIERQSLGEPGRQPIETSPAPTDGSNEPAVALPPDTHVADLQVLLDRKGASPGVIDGKLGSNVDKALAALREITGLHLRQPTRKLSSRCLPSGGVPGRS